MRRIWVIGITVVLAGCGASGAKPASLTVKRSYTCAFTDLKESDAAMASRCQSEREALVKAACGPNVAAVELTEHGIHDDVNTVVCPKG